MPGTLVLAGAMAVLAGCVYAYVASRLPLPASPPASRRAMRMLSLWWYALALNIALVGLTYFLGASGALTVEVQHVSSHLQRLLLAVSMVGLMHYMLYLLTGRDLLVPLVAVYGAYFVYLTYGLFSQEPNGVFVGAWRTDLTYAVEPPPQAQLVNLSAILLPPVVCSLLYLRVGLRTKDATRRWRTLLVSSALLFWWAVAVVAGQRSALEDTPLQAANRLLSVLAAIAVLAAYLPPEWARRRWGIEPAHAA